MAHIVFGMYGIKKDVDEAVKWLETRIYNLPMTEKATGKKFNQPITANLRPIYLFDYVVPKEAVEPIVNSLNLQDAVYLTDGKGTPFLKKTFNMVRKFLKLNKIPEVDKTKGTLMLPQDLFRNIRMIGIGTKDDIIMDFSNGLEHEAI